jgi:membrane-bound metal-dependent hydrolase YbcI (DUF457 family)
MVMVAALCIYEYNVGKLNITFVLLSLLGAGIGTLLPDLDTVKTPTKNFHRKALHNLFVILGIPVIMRVTNFPDVFVLSFFVAEVSHLMGDYLSDRGIALFWPFKNKEYGGKGVLFDNSTAKGFAINSIITIFIGIVSALLFLAFWEGIVY